MQNSVGDNKLKRRREDLEASLQLEKQVSSKRQQVFERHLDIIREHENSKLEIAQAYGKIRYLTSVRDDSYDFGGQTESFTLKSFDFDASDFVQTVESAIRSHRYRAGLRGREYERKMEDARVALSKRVAQAQAVFDRLKLDAEQELEERHEEAKKLKSSEEETNSEAKELTTRLQEYLNSKKEFENLEICGIRR